jgi:hypothetical protein
MRTNKIKPSQAVLLAQAKKKAEDLAFKAASLKLQGQTLKATGTAMKLKGEELKRLGQQQAKNYNQSNLLRSTPNALYTGTKGVKSIGGGKIAEVEKGLKVTDNKSGGSNLDLHKQTTVVDTIGYSKGKKSFPATTIVSGEKQTKSLMPRQKVKNILNQ